MRTVADLIIAPGGKNLILHVPTLGEEVKVVGPKIDIFNRGEGGAE